MKKYSYLFLLIVFVFTSCDDDPFTTFDSNNEFLQFQSTTASVGEGGEPIAITVILGSGANANGVNVNFTVMSDQMDRFTVMPANGSIEIPAGEFSADIMIQPIDNLLVDGSFDVTISLASSDLPIGIAGEQNEFVTTIVSILDDDCPVDSQGLVGTYMVEEVFTDGGNMGLSLAANVVGAPFQLDLTLDDTDPTGTTFFINNSPGFAGYFADGTVIVLNSCPRTFSFPGGNPLLANFAVMVLDDADNSATTFDDEAFTIQGDGPLGGFGPYQFLLTKI